MKTETQIMKNLFTAFAADIEKVVNDMRKPHAAFPLSIPPEVIDYWLHNIEVIMGEKY
jgi:hypothetical protein